jgi:hypothetical protein
MLNLTVSVAAGYELTFNWLPSFDSLTLLPGAGYYFNLNDAISKEAPCKCRYEPNLCALEVEGSHKELKLFEQVESISIIDKNFTFFSDPTGDEYDIKFDNNINLNQWSKTLREALKIVETDKLSDQLVKNYVTFLVPLRQNKNERNLSFSVRNLPGVIFKNNEITPHLIGETLVHEADHQFFYAVERFNKFWKSDVRQQKPTYYSPWRDDPRPIDGVLRGLSAFTRVSKYYSSALESYQFTKEEHEVVGRLFLSRIEEAKAAFEIISGEEQLSDFGTKYLIDIRDILSQSKASAEKHPQYDRWRNLALDNIEKHRKNWQKLNHVEL